MNITLHALILKKEPLNGCSKNNVEVQQTQVLATTVSAAGCGKSYVMGAIVTFLKNNNLVVTKLAPSGVAASLIKGTTIHIVLKLDITCKTSLENGTVRRCYSC